MMKERGLSRSLRLMFSGGVAVGLGLLTQSVQAQETNDSKLQRVEITGSSIKRLSAQGALPVTLIRTDELLKEGVTTAQEALNKIPSNQSSVATSNAVGSSTGGQSAVDLRGIGKDKTLVLLNGRRLPKHPYDGDSVDLNIIPLSAIDRIEVLRDGASAIYGTDAIGGVVNFITKRSVTGVTIGGDLVAPRASGGSENHVNLTAGKGDLDQDGFNLFGILDFHQQNHIKSTDRDFAKTGLIPSQGLDRSSGTSFPANTNVGNPYAAVGCRPPLSNPGGHNTCREDTTALIDILPDTQQVSAFGKGSLKLGQDHVASLELLHSESKVTSRVAPPPLTGYTLPSTSPFYPGGSGGTPALAGATGQDLSIGWRAIDAGPRTTTSVSKADRVLLSLEGVLAGWDYKSGLSYSDSRTKDWFTNGYVNNQKVKDAVFNGLLNPFNSNDAAGLALLHSYQMRGTVLSATNKTESFDLTASRELLQLPAGPLGIAFGTQLTHESAAFNVNEDIAIQAASSGLTDAKSTAGSRNIYALFSELNIPIIKNLEAQLAGRFDRYNDVGNTFNPKIALRYQPIKQLLLRGSASTGFRAPTLFEKNKPQELTYTANSYDDPLQCPGGNPVAGADPSVACNQQFFRRTGGNKDLQPEKSKTFTLGFVVEPVSNVTASIDYWNIHIKNTISGLPEQSIFGDPVKYADRYVRNPDGTLAYVVQINDNLGDTKTSGVDVGLNWRLGKTAWGNFAFSLDGTYVSKYDYQNEKNGEFIHNAGRYADANPVFRWRHTASILWNSGPWGVNLTQTYLSHYTDASPGVDGKDRKVPAYTLYNVSASYSGVKNLVLTAGIKNLFDKNPPFTNQDTQFQVGYDPRYTDAIGRALFIRANYQFM